ncbi:TetR family transcriptional regulator [Microbacteriaceae bacterium VKM Ac-2855]|nr:TetR family transcriptional regulator [Microbacteriaceae bacterium VKM Ac-2855]
MITDERAPDALAGGSRRARTRQQLLDAALHVITSIGVQDSSVERITDHARLTRGAFYSNFRSKDHFLRTLVRRENDARLDALRQLVAAAQHTIVVRGEDLEHEDFAATVVEVVVGSVDSWPSCILASELEVLAARDSSFASLHHDFRVELHRSIEEIVAASLTQRGQVCALDLALCSRLILSVLRDSIRSSMLHNTPIGLALDRARLDLAQVMGALIRPA